MENVYAASACNSYRSFSFSDRIVASFVVDLYGSHKFPYYRTFNPLTSRSSVAKLTFLSMQCVKMQKTDFRRGVRTLVRRTVVVVLSLLANEPVGN